MANYIILGDSTSDLSLETRKQYNIEYAIMNFLCEGKESPASLDWDEISPKEFYDLMRDGKKVTTTQVPYNVFYEKFTECAEKGLDVLYISCSSGLSGSVNTARLVRNEILEKYPNMKIEIVDSLISSLGQGGLLIDAAKLRDEGKTIEEVRDYIEDNKLKVHQAGTVATLDYLKRAGRIKASKAFFGNLFGVKPIIISDIKGQNYAYKKVKGRRSSLLQLVEEMKEHIIDPESQTIYITHADSIEDAMFVKEHIEREINCKDILINYVGPAVGASVGPGTIIVFCKGEEVTIEGE